MEMLSSGVGDEAVEGYLRIAIFSIEQAKGHLPPGLSDELATELGDVLRVLRRCHQPHHAASHHPHHATSPPEHAAAPAAPLASADSPSKTSAVAPMPQQLALAPPSSSSDEIEPFDSASSPPSPAKAAEMRGAGGVNHACHDDAAPAALRRETRGSVRWQKAAFSVRDEAEHGFDKQLPHLAAPSYEHDAQALLFRSRCRALYTQLDTNDDGALTPCELSSAAKKLGLGRDELMVMFNEADKNNDAQIGLDEFVDLMAGANGEMLNAMDENHHDDDEKKGKVVIVTFGNREFACEGSSKHLFSPFHPATQAFELVIVTVLAITLFTTPLCFAYASFERAMRKFDLAIDVLFMVDVCRNFNTAFIDADDVAVFDARRVAKRYLTGWFLLDLASSLPYARIFKQSRGDTFVTKGTKGMKMLRLLRLAKLLRLIRLSRMVSTVRKRMVSVLDGVHVHVDSGYFEIAKLLCSFGLAVHWLACLNFMVAREHDFPDGSWVVVSGLYDEPWGRQYKWSVYKALAQMIVIGHGERGSGRGEREHGEAVGGSAPIIATTCYEERAYCETEQWVTLGGLYIGLFFQSVLISQISKILVEMSISRQRFREEMRLVNEYMRAKVLPPELRDRVREYYAVQYRGGNIFEEKVILSKLSTPLRLEILQYNSRELANIVPLLRNTPPKAFRAMSQHLEPRILTAHEDVVVEGDVVDNSSLMFFMLSGTASVWSQARRLDLSIDPDSPLLFKAASAKMQQKASSSASTSADGPAPLRRASTGLGAHVEQANARCAAQAAAERSMDQVVLTRISSGCYFGEVALVLATGKRCATVHADTNLVCYTLTADALKRSLGGIPYVRAYFELIAQRRLERVERLSALAELVEQPEQRARFENALSHIANRDEEDAQTDFCTMYNLSERFKLSGHDIQEGKPVRTLA